MFLGKPEEIVVEPNSEYLIWEIPVQGIKAKKVVLRVESGCEAIFYVDGHPYSYGPNKYGDLAWRRELKAGSKVSLVGVNRSKVFKSTFGVGHIPFHDWETDCSVEVGLYGDCEFTVLDGNRIYEAFGGSLPVSPEDINDKLLLKFQEYLKSELSKVLERYDYFTVNQSVNDLSTVLEKCFKEEFVKDGIMISRCSVSGTTFPSNYAQERQARIDARKNKREAERDKKEEMEFLKGLDASVPKCSKEETDRDKDKDTRFCPRCGGKLDVDAKYCKYCGIKL